MKRFHLISCILVTGLILSSCQNLYNTEQPEFEITELISTPDYKSNTVEFEIKGVCKKQGWRVKKCLVEREPPENLGGGSSKSQVVWIRPYFERDESIDDLSFTVKHTEKTIITGQDKLKFEFSLFPVIKFRIGTKDSYKTYTYCSK